MRNRNDATIRADDLWDLKNCMPLSQRTTLLVARKENIGLTQDSRNFKLVVKQCQRIGNDFIHADVAELRSAGAGEVQQVVDNL